MRIATILALRTKILTTAMLGVEDMVLAITTLHQAMRGKMAKKKNPNHDRHRPLEEILMTTMTACHAAKKLNVPGQEQQMWSWHLPDQQAGNDAWMIKKEHTG